MMNSEEEVGIKALLNDFIKNPPLPCERCGQCCRIPVELDLSQGRLLKIARYLKISISEFKQKYRLRRAQSGRWIMPTAPCPFLVGENACSIYEHRPTTCRHYPFGHLRNAFYNRTTQRFTAFCPIIVKALANHGIK